ncbi:NAD(P)H-binding protein [Chitinophaga sp. Mgbs1]|uniref:NAD(P)H-binding protein n=1 Tax=Chitinophaga solisilvae TaxID=1233460 RepID=A0A9Q5D0M5_9BACT|nr:NAD(P)H-binding protein [Chitinophaga solisilvae]
MKITLTGSLGNINQYLIPQLVTAGHQVTVISQQPERAAAMTALGATAAIGSVKDRVFLQQAFTGADIVYTMIPPDYAARDLRAYIRATGENYAAAIAQAGVKYVVNLSAVGAHDAAGAGPAGASHDVEAMLNTLTDTHILHLRPGMFYSNFYGAIPLIKYQQLLGNNFSGDVEMALTHPADIAAAAAKAMNRLFTGKQIQYVVSDVKTGDELASILGAAIAMPHLSWTAFSDEALLASLQQNGFSEEMAMVYMIEIGIALRNNTLLSHFRQYREQAYGEIRFSAFAEEFAKTYMA